MVHTSTPTIGRFCTRTMMEIVLRNSIAELNVIDIRPEGPVSYGGGNSQSTVEVMKIASNYWRCRASGSELARAMRAETMDVVLIDNDSRAVKNAQSLDALVIHGDITSRHSLQEGRHQ